jgi:hypothetical protein
VDTDLVRNVARGLRCRPLQRLIVRAVMVRDLAAVEDAVRSALGPDLPEGCRLLGPEPHYREGAVAKYGVLDLRFSAGEGLFGEDARTGVPLLRELGFLPGGGEGPSHRVCDDPLCLETLRDDISEGRTFLLMFLEGGRPGEGGRVAGPDGKASLRVPEGYLPHPFLVADACVTNASGVWLWKHFYL